jgi:hypothetical protein
VARFVLALDLGQTAEFTALTVIEEGDGKPRALAVRHLRRFPPGTAYGAIGAAVAETVRDGGLGRPPLVADLTAVGPGLLPSLRTAVRPAWVTPVLLTAGQTAGKEDDGLTRVPKRDLVTALQLVLQERRLRVAPALPDAPLLVREMTAFRAKVTLAESDAADWRERPADDLVLAVALAAWWLAEHPVYGPDAYGAGGDDLRKVLDRLFPPPPEPTRW